MTRRCHVSRVDEAVYMLEIDYKRNISASINIPHVVRRGSSFEKRANLLLVSFPLYPDKYFP